MVPSSPRTASRWTINEPTGLEGAARIPSGACVAAGFVGWRADRRLLIALGVSRETVRIEPPRALLDVEPRVIELARAHVVERGAGV